MVESWVPSDAAGFPESFPPSVWLLPHSSADANFKLGDPFLGPQQGRMMQQPPFEPRQRPHQQQGNRPRGHVPR
jgi:hypothetical protein